MKLRSQLRFIGPLFLFTILLLSPGFISNTSASQDPVLDVDIVDAWYEDGEGDGNENDIFAILHFDINTEYQYSIVSYDITLTKPSGANVTHQENFVTSDTNFNITHAFWDEVTEGGWYTVSIEASLYCSSEISTSSLTFDPPGGDNSDPT